MYIVSQTADPNPFRGTQCIKKWSKSGEYNVCTYIVPCEYNGGDGEDPLVSDEGDPGARALVGDLSGPKEPTNLN